MYGDKFDVKRFLKISGWKVLCSSVKGEERSVRNKYRKIVKTGKISDVSGFNLNIYSSNSYSTALCNNGIKKTLKFIKANRYYLELLRKNKTIEICIDVGILTNKKFSVHTYFKGEFLKLIYKYNIALATTVYL